MNQTISEKTKINIWAKIVPVSIVILSVSHLKIFAVGVLVAYLISLLAFYKLIDKWDSPVVKHLWHLLKNIGIALSFLIGVLFVHFIIYLGAA